MKVLVFASSYLPVPNCKGGAIETLLTNFIETIDDDMELTIYSIYDKEIDGLNLSKYKNCRFRYIKKSFIYKFVSIVLYCMAKFLHLQLANAFYYFVLKDIKKHNEALYYDEVIVINKTSYAKVLMKSMKKVKKILYLHNDYLYSGIKNAEMLTSYYDEIWCVSEYIKKRVESVKGSIGKASVIYNGIKTKQFANLVESTRKTEILDRYQLQNAFCFLYVGRILPVKGIMELVQAFRKINQVYPHTKLLICGQPKNYRQRKYMKKVKKAGSENVIYLGEVENERLAVFYQIANVLVVPSMWNEPFGLVLVEAMAAKLPIIATCSGGIVEVMKESGMTLVNKDNVVEELIDAMKDYVDNYGRKKQLVINYDGILEQFQNEVFVDSLKKKIRNVGDYYEYENSI